MDRICSFYGAFGAVRLQPAPPPGQPTRVPWHGLAGWGCGPVPHSAEGALGNAAPPRVTPAAKARTVPTAGPSGRPATRRAQG